MTTQEYEAVFMDAAVPTAQIDELLRDPRAVPELNAALRNPEVPLRVLRRALSSSEVAVRMVARSVLDDRHARRSAPTREAPKPITLEDLQAPEVPIKVIRQAQLSRDRKVRKRATELLNQELARKQAQRPINRAANPQTDQDDLQQLVGHPSRMVRERARANPSLEPGLAEALKLLEGGGELTRDQMVMLARCGAWVQERLLLIPDLPEEVFQQIAAYGGAALVAKHAGAPVALLDQLSRDGDEAIKVLVAENPRTSGRALELLISSKRVGRDLSGEQDEYDLSPIIARVAAHPNLGSRAMLDLTSLDDWEVQESLARKPNLEVEVINALMDRLGPETNPEIMANLAQQHRLPVDKIAILAGVSHERVRRMVAAHPKTPGAILQILSEDRDTRVRLEVAAHFATPQEVLERMATDADPLVSLAAKGGDLTHKESAVRRAALRNPRLGSTEIKQAFEVERDWMVRRLMIAHPALPQEIRKEYFEKYTKSRQASQRDTRNSQTSWRNPLPEEGLASYRDKIFDQIVGARNISAFDRDAVLELRTFSLSDRLTPELAKLLLNSGHTFVLEALSLQTARLSAGKFLGTMPKYLDVMKGLIKNGIYYRELFEFFADSVENRNNTDANDNSVDFSEIVNILHNQINTRDIEEASGKHGLLDARQVERFISSRSLDVRLELVKNKSLATTVKARLANDQEPQVRIALAEVQDLEPEVLVQLAGDPEQMVQAAVLTQTTLAAQVLIQLATSNFPDIRRMVANRDETPEEALVILAGDPEWEIALNVLNRKPMPTPPVLASLARSQSVDIRKQVAALPETPQEAICLLARDTEVDVVRAVLGRETLEAPELTALAQRRPVSELLAMVRSKLISNKETPPEAFLAMVRWNDGQTHSDLAQHSRSSTEVLEAIFKRTGSTYAFLLAKHPNASPGLLERMATYHSSAGWRVLSPIARILPIPAQSSEDRKRLYQIIRSNPNCSPELAEYMDRSLKNQALPGVILGISAVVLLVSLTWWRFEWLMTVSSPLCINPPAPEIVAGQTIRQTIFEEIRVGTGREARIGSSIRFRYIGRLANGNLFDSSCKRGRSSTFTLGSQGWGETLVGMKEGGIRRVVVSPVGGVMQSKAMVYDVELAEVVLKPRVPSAPK